MTVIPAKAGIKKRRSSQKKIYICDLRKKPKIKRETHKIMGVPLYAHKIMGVPLYAQGSL
jgi:hypothetical protein